MKNSKLKTKKTMETTVTTRKIRTSANAPEHLFYPTGQSMTVPNQVPDLRQMIHRKKTGMAVPVFDGIYSEEDYPEFEKMDVLEVLQYRNNLTEIIQEKERELHVTSKILQDKQNPETQEAI